MSDRAGAPRDSRAMLVGCALVVVSTVAFSGKAVLAKIMYRDGVDPLSVIALRMGLSLPVFALSAIFHERTLPKLSRRDAASVILLGGVGYYASVYGDFAGLRYISAGLERLVMFSYPTLVLLMSALVFRQRVRLIQVACLLITYAGIALAFRAEAGSSSTRDVFIGGSLVFGSAFCYAAYLVLGTRFIDRLGAPRFTSLSLSAACVAGLLHALLSGRALGGYSVRVYALALTMALVATVLPAFALALGIRRIGPAVAAILGTIGPASTLFLAHSLLGEPVSVTQLGGAALVVVGATLVVFRGR